MPELKHKDSLNSIRRGDCNEIKMIERFNTPFEKFISDPALLEELETFPQVVKDKSSKISITK